MKSEIPKSKKPYESVITLKETDVYSGEWILYYLNEPVATIKRQADPNQWYQFYTITFTDSDVETQQAVGFEEALFRALYDIGLLKVEENNNV